MSSCLALCYHSRYLLPPSCPKCIDFTKSHHEWDDSLPKVPASMVRRTFFQSLQQGKSPAKLLGLLVEPWAKQRSKPSVVSVDNASKELRQLRVLWLKSLWVKRPGNVHHVHPTWWDPERIPTGKAWNRGLGQHPMIIDKPLELLEGGVYERLFELMLRINWALEATSWGSR